MILTIDFGSSSLKSALFSWEGDLSYCNRHSYQDQFHSRSPQTWIQAFSDALKALPSNKITAISLSGNGPSLVPTDEQLNILTPMIFWQDYPPSPAYESYYLPGLIAYRDNYPEKYQRTKTFLPTAEFFGWLLTGEISAVSPQKDFDRKLWSIKELVESGIEPEKLPPIVPIHKPIGLITPLSSKKWPLPAGIPVYSAGSDFIAALIGTGTIKPGKTLDRAGSSEGLNTTVVKPVSWPKLKCLPHIQPDLFNVAYFPGQTGSTFEFYRTRFGLDHIGYDKLIDSVINETIKNPEPVFLPGKTLEEGLFTGMKSITPIGQLAAVTRTLASLFQEGIITMEKAGLSISEISVCGGQAKSVSWNRIKASISGKTIITPEIPDAELLGCAMLAIADRNHCSVESLGETCVKYETPIEPDHKLRGILQNYLTRFLEIKRTHSN